MSGRNNDNDVDVQIASLLVEVKWQTDFFVQTIDTAHFSADNWIRSNSCLWPQEFSTNETDLGMIFFLRWWGKMEFEFGENVTKGQIDGLRREREDQEVGTVNCH